jgi:hypothetical protein
MTEDNVTLKGKVIRAPLPLVDATIWPNPDVPTDGASQDATPKIVEMARKARADLRAGRTKPVPSEI